jgi:hypothetical protein
LIFEYNPMSLTLSRYRFLPPDTFSSLPISSIAQHPNAPLLAVARAGGHVELWASPSNERVGRPSSSPLLASLSTGASSSNIQSASNWFLISSIRSCGVSSSLSSSSKSSFSSPFPVQIQHLCWILSPLPSSSSKSNIGTHETVIEGARLLVATLGGQVLEADFTGLRLLHAIDSNAGAVWSMAAFDLRRAGCGARSGSIIALGCEDGSVRLLRVHTHSGLSIERLSRCSGTDGRVLSVAWHTHSPVLCAGTAGGTLRCWDCAPIVAEEVLVRQKEAEMKKKKENALTVITEASVTTNGLFKIATISKKGSPSVGLTQSLSSSVQSVKNDEDEDDNDEEVEDDNEDTTTLETTRNGSSHLHSAAPRPVFRIQVDPQQIGRKGNSNGRNSGKTKHVKTTLVWCVVILSDMTVITGDSNGDVLSWDGKLGVASHSGPIARLEGAVLSLDAHEDEPGSVVTLVAGGFEGRVSIATRAPPFFNDTGSTDASHLQHRWALVASHRSHIADVCAISVYRTSALPGTVSVVSAASDGRLCSVSISSFPYSASSVSRFINTSWQGPSKLVSLSGLGGSTGGGGGEGGAGLHLACFNSSGTSLQVWKVDESGTKTPHAEHLLQINTPRLSSTGNVLDVSNSRVFMKRNFQIQESSLNINTGSRMTTGKSQLEAIELEGDLPAEFPLNGFPSAVSISDDSKWLCYSIGGGRVPPTLFSLNQSQNIRKDTAGILSPTTVQLPLVISSLFGKKHSSSVSLLQIISISSSSGLLVMVIGLRLYVCLCSQILKQEKEKESTSTISSLSTSTECTFLYSLPVPRGISDPVTVIAGRSRKRARSSTSDSLSNIGTNIAKSSTVTLKSRDVESDNDDTLLEAEVSHSAQIGSASTGAVIPISLSSSPVIEGVVSLAIATSSRHVHIYRLSEARGSLIVTLPRLSSLPTAVSFATCAAEQTKTLHGVTAKTSSVTMITTSKASHLATSFAVCVALRSGNIEFFSADSGRLLSWSPDSSSLFPNSFISNCCASPVRALLPITSCPSGVPGAPLGSSQPYPFKLIAVSSTAVTPLVFSFNSNTASHATSVSSQCTSITCSSSAIVSSGVRFAQVLKHGIEERSNKYSLAVVEDSQSDIHLSKGAVNVKKKKYGQV